MSDQAEPAGPTAEPKNLGGRPRYNPTKEVREIVQAMCVAGLKVSMMARIIGVDRATFRAAFKEERKLSKAKLVAQLVSRLVKHTEKSVPATIFALCNLDPENWSNKHMVAHEGGDPMKPIKHTHTIRVIGGLPDPDGIVIDQPAAAPEPEIDPEIEPAQKLLAEI